MLKFLMLAAAVTLTLSMSIAMADEQKPQEVKNVQGIRAEVLGTLHFEAGRGYFISIKPADKGGRDTHVWLRAAEDKALVRELQELDGKEVIARGSLAQLPQDFQANVPPLGMYLQHGFRIERAGKK